MRIGMRKIKASVAAENCKVRTEFKNKDLVIVSERECSLRDYVDTLRATIIRMIPDVEDLSYRATDGKSKEEWPSDVMDSFQRVRHKLLDTAGEIERLPDSMFFEVFETEELPVQPHPTPSSPPVSPTSFSQQEDVELEEKSTQLSGISGWSFFKSQKEK